jgi:hypothetical protein
MIITMENVKTVLHYAQMEASLFAMVAIAPMIYLAITCRAMTRCVGE